MFLIGLIGVAAREILRGGAPDADRAKCMSPSLTRARPTIAPRRAASSAGSWRSIATGPRRRAPALRSRTRRARSSTGATSSTSPSARCCRPLDDKAQGEIADAAKRVSLVTAISPRAILDVVFVIAQIIRLVRRIAEIYGGRPGLLGLIKLARSIGAHIAITGGMAVGDSLLQQIVGHGIASRISARMGEGVLNGLLTARVGLSALAVCRPAPFAVDKPPGVSDVAPFLFSGGKGE